MTSKNNNNVQSDDPVVHFGQGSYSRYMTSDGKWHYGDPSLVKSEDLNDNKEEDNKEDYKPGDHLDITA